MSNRQLFAAAIVSACGIAFQPTTAFADRQPVHGPERAGPFRASSPQFAPPQIGLPRLASPTGIANVLQSYDGVSFSESSCNCLPPDTNVAVGNNFVAETVNFKIRVWDKTSGAILLDKTLSSFFGAFSQGDPYVVYDDTADRWYVVAFNSDLSGLFLAVSQSGDPTKDWKVYPLTNLGGFPDFAKMGFNKDAIFVSYNDFGSNHDATANVISIDKRAILSGTLLYYVSKPAEYNFRALPPAQMHGDQTGGVEWFVSTDGSDYSGSKIRVYKMTNYLSNSPTFSLTSLSVTPYRYAYVADQPGGPSGGWINTSPNTTTTQLHYRNGHLLTAMASSLAADGNKYPKGIYYQIGLVGDAPVLLKEGFIDPGPGVAVQMVTVDEDSRGSLGLTWFESSAQEYMSMWVGTVPGPTLPGGFRSANLTPNAGYMYYNYREGDYSTTVLDPDGRTFWSANEYVGKDGWVPNIWRTHIASFAAGPVTTDQCKNGGWANFNFVNQGLCVSWVVSNGDQTASALTR
jgi:hypothetical protein